MGKRNVRILRQQLPERLSELMDKEVHVVLLDGRTKFGKVTKTSSEGLHLQDINARWTNKRRHTHRLLTKDIMEVIYDVVADH